MLSLISPPARAGGGFFIFLFFVCSSSGRPTPLKLGQKTGHVSARSKGSLAPNSCVPAVLDIVLSTCLTRSFFGFVSEDISLIRKTDDCESR